MQGFVVQLFAALGVVAFAAAGLAGLAAWLAVRYRGPLGAAAAALVARVPPPGGPTVAAAPVAPSPPNPEPTTDSPERTVKNGRKPPADL